MQRRRFLASLAAAVPGALAAQAGPPQRAPVEAETAGTISPSLLHAVAAPRIGCSHLGFFPQGPKLAVIRGDGARPALTGQFTLWDVGDWRPVFRGRLRPAVSDFGPAALADFSPLERPGMYQLDLGRGPRGVGTERSVPFFLAEDVWRRTLPVVFGYFRYQRCGVAVPGVHPVCHLDDARRRDTGEHVDEVGGWHDAGDLRKWMSTTPLNALALLQLRRLLPAPRPGDPPVAAIQEEFRHGNLYFLKMQDADGKIWHDVAGGVNGDNSDNHWTDNIVGTADDRYINTHKTALIAALFTTVEAMAAQEFAATDPSYARRMLAAGIRAWAAFTGHGGGTAALAWWTLAAIELARATGQAGYAAAARRLGERLLARQAPAGTGLVGAVGGYWRSGAAPDSPPFVDIRFSAIPALALLELHGAFPAHPRSGAWLAAGRAYLDHCVLPLAARNAYGIVPTGLYARRESPETYRPLGGGLSYRYFLPVRKQFWWQGANCHLAAHAMLLARYASALGAGEASVAYRHLALRQLEWIAGANPFGASQITAVGLRQPFPHSRFVGLIPGGIMNGIAGDAADQPILDRELRLDWRTCEYWSPHVAYFLWAVAALSAA